MPRVIISVLSSGFLMNVMIQVAAMISARIVMPSIMRLVYQKLC